MFFYDPTGICGFKYSIFSGDIDSESVYFYRKNLQGDITAIYSSDGTKVAEYLYDAWGNCTIVTDIDGIASLNPIRYRGYYYDTETGLYYLNSRYYDPNTGRFINADVGITTKQGILGYNLFNYCLNNPVAMVDGDGMNADTAGWWASTMWWLCGADTVLPVGDMIYFGVAALLLAATAETLTEAPAITIPKFSKKKKEKEEDITDAATDVLPMPNDDSGKTYYHATTLESAMLIISTGKMIGSALEGGYVFAWELRPSKRAVLASGAHTEVIISFETSASFIKDVGIEDPMVLLYRPVVSSSPDRLQ